MHNLQFALMTVTVQHEQSAKRKHVDCRLLRGASRGLVVRACPCLRAAQHAHAQLRQCTVPQEPWQMLAAPMMERCSKSIYSKTDDLQVPLSAQVANTCLCQRGRPKPTCTSMVAVSTTEPLQSFVQPHLCSGFSKEQPEVHVICRCLCWARWQEPAGA